MCATKDSERTIRESKLKQFWCNPAIYFASDAGAICVEEITSALTAGGMMSFRPAFVRFFSYHILVSASCHPSSLYSSTKIGMMYASSYRLPQLFCRI
jgi:hypothetical protein